MQLSSPLDRIYHEEHEAHEKKEQKVFVFFVLLVVSGFPGIAAVEAGSWRAVTEARRCRAHHDSMSCARTPWTSSKSGLTNL